MIKFSILSNTALTLLFCLSQAHSQIQLPKDPVEAPLQTISEKIQQQDWQTAIEISRQLKVQYPEFKLSDILLDIIDQQKPPPVQKPILIAPETDEYIETNLLAEYYLRTHYKIPFNHQQDTQNIIIKLAKHIQHAVLIDVHSSRLYLLENSNDGLLPIADYYIGIGKQGVHKQFRGDHRTPLGIYTIVEYIPDDKLLELYGTGAFPIDYPNTWDKRLGYTGSGIWLHGVPRSTYSRAPRSSRGCITISNSLFEHLRPYITVEQTPIIISKRVLWSEGFQSNETEKEINDALQTWLSDWQSLEADAYLSHYHPDFLYHNGNLESWAAYKQTVNKNKKSIEIAISNLSIFNYPLEEKLILIRYTQDYRSDTFKSIRKKEQYWKKHRGHWKIINEKVL